MWGCCEPQIRPQIRWPALLEEAPALERKITQSTARTLQLGGSNSASFTSTISVRLLTLSQDGDDARALAERSYELRYQLAYDPFPGSFKMLGCSCTFGALFRYLVMRLRTHQQSLETLCLVEDVPFERSP